MRQLISNWNMGNQIALETCSCHHVRALKDYLDSELAAFVVGFGYAPRVPPQAVIQSRVR